MKISKVFYELFNSDYLSIKGHENDDFHEIDREICLEFTDGTKIYISWADKPIQFCIGHKDSSWNINQPEIILDASEWKIWKNIINQEVEIIYLDNEKQILELKSKNTSIFLSSQENCNWETDVLHISLIKPKYYR
jgi:hypothetical protein